MPASIADEIGGGSPPSMGFVDGKVCAVDAVWSGLKHVIRVTER